MQFIQAALGAAAVWLVGETARRVFGERAGLLAAALAALSGVLTFNEVLLLQSAVDPFLTALSLFLLARALEPEARPPASLRKAVLASPASAAAHEALGLALGFQDRLDEAERHFRRGLSSRPWRRIGAAEPRRVLARRGRLAEARARAEEALHLRPDYAQARALLEQLTGGQRR